MRHKPFAAARLGAAPTDREPIGPVAHPRAAVEPPVLLSPRAILESLFSFEALLVLYMFAGMYKNDPRFAWIPVDATGLFFALSVLVGSFIIIRNPIRKRAFPVIFAMLAFVAWWALTLTWSPSRIYGPDKVFLMATLVLWALTAAALIIAPRPERVRRLFTLLLLFAIWIGIEALLIYGQGEQGFVQVGGQNYLGLGRVVGLGALVAFTSWLFGRPMSFVNVLFLVLFAALAFVAMIGGGRGPVLAIAGPILLTLLLGPQLARRRILYKRRQISIIWLMSALIAGLSTYIAVTDRIPRSLERLETTIVQGEVGSRVKRYEDTFEYWPEAPVLGQGAGSWPILEGTPEWRTGSYPHNLFFETLVESGVVGLILLVALLVVALRPISFERLRNDPLALCTFMLFVSAFINAMVSADIPDNRTLFMMLGLLTLFTVGRGTPRPAAQQSVLSLARQPKAVASLGFGNGRKP
jgi:O-antigen ligase